MFDKNNLPTVTEQVVHSDSIKRRSRCDKLPAPPRPPPPDVSKIATLPRKSEMSSAGMSPLPTVFLLFEVQPRCEAANEVISVARKKNSPNFSKTELVISE